MSIRSSDSEYQPEDFAYQKRLFLILRLAKIIFSASIFWNFMSSKRYKENPFLGEMVLDIKERQVRLSPLGKDKNILVNQDTGEVRGTHVVTYRRVDSEQFIKLFTRTSP